jgi:hypothetical protein
MSSPPLHPLAGSTMNALSGNIPIIMPIESALDHPWLLNDQILQNTIKRLSENSNFLSALPDQFSYRCLSRQIRRDVPSVKDRIFVGSEHLWLRLLQMMDLTNSDHLMVIPENGQGPTTSELQCAF